MKKSFRLSLCFVLISCSLTFSQTTVPTKQSPKQMIRIAEIEIEPAYLDAYLSILKEESAASIKIETGVISIFPMFQKEFPNIIRILEIYASREAYEQHLKTPHFLHYKSATLAMVKSLKLVEMEAIDPASMPFIFQKQP